MVNLGSVIVTKKFWISEDKRSREDQTSPVYIVVPTITQNHTVLGYLKYSDIASDKTQLGKLFQTSILDVSHVFFSTSLCHIIRSDAAPNISMATLLTKDQVAMLN